jgi:hypothetical protein
MSPFLQAAAAGLVVMGGGAATYSAMQGDPPPLAIPDGDWVPGSALDGKVFYTIDRITGSDEVLEDELHFVDGRFQSAMCQDYCDFGWSEYQTWTEGETIHFRTTTACPDAPHTVMWYGTVTGDEIAIEVNWTTARWYWTRHLHATGAGSTTPPPEEAPAG